MTLQVKQKKSIQLNGTKKKITWSTSNKKIATVKKTGKKTAKITGIKVGTCKIRAKVAKKVYTCKVTVKKKKSVDVTNTPEVTVAPTQLPEVTELPNSEPQATEDVSSTEVPATETPVATDILETSENPETTEAPKFLHTEGKNADTIAELEKIMDTQTVSGSAISTDFDSEQYTWNESGELLKLNWNQVGLTGILELKHCAVLQALDCSSNQLESVNVKDCKQLQSLKVSQNRLTDLQLTACDKLTYLDCMNQAENTGVINLDLTGFVHLI